MARPQSGKSSQSINFDDEVLIRMKEMAHKERTTLSELINFVCRRIFENDESYNRERAKFHYVEFMRYKYITDQLENKKIELNNMR